MNRIEIETITEAMVKKQTWIRKEMQTFLDAWGKITSENIDGFKHLKLANTGNDDQAKDIYLTRGEAHLNFNPSYVDYGEDEDYYLLDKKETDANDYITSTMLRSVIEEIPEKLTKYFQNMQNKIDAYSVAGQELSRIINCLK